jgi:hypothetical protein
MFALVGGHSIDGDGPVARLERHAQVASDHILRKGGLVSATRLILTRPLGPGILLRRARCAELAAPQPRLMMLLAEMAPLPPQAAGRSGGARRDGDDGMCAAWACSVQLGELLNCERRRMAELRYYPPFRVYAGALAMARAVLHRLSFRETSRRFPLTALAEIDTRPGGVV